MTASGECFIIAGMKLADYLTKQDLSLQRFADLLRPQGIHVTRETVRTWAAGTRLPRMESLQAIRVVTGGKVQPNDFVERA